MRRSDVIQTRSDYSSIDLLYVSELIGEYLYEGWAGVGSSHLEPKWKIKRTQLLESGIKTFFALDGLYNCIWVKKDTYF
jgi:hypothetical protein